MFNKFCKYTLELFFRNNFAFTSSGLDRILFTFDDGPHPEHTPIIIDALEKRNIKAIFFVTGKALECYPEMGKLIVQKGHALGNHTYEHLDLKKCSFKEYRNSIEQTFEIIASFQPGGEKIFRPPYGRLTPKLLAYIVSAKLLLMNWSVDSNDSFISNSHILLNYIKSLTVDKGDIILFHEDYQHTAAIINDVVDYFYHS